MNNEPYYTTDTVASHLARSFKNILRFTPDSGSFEELNGEWREIDDVRFEHYIRSALNAMLGHAMNIGEEARNELYALNNEASFTEVQSKASELLRYEPPVVVQEEPSEVRNG